MERCASWDKRYHVLVMYIRHVMETSGFVMAVKEVTIEGILSTSTASFPVIQSEEGAATICASILNVRAESIAWQAFQKV